MLVLLKKTVVKIYLVRGIRFLLSRRSKDKTRFIVLVTHQNHRVIIFIPVDSANALINSFILRLYQHCTNVLSHLVVLCTELISDNWVLIFIMLVLNYVVDFLGVGLVDLSDGTLQVLRVGSQIDCWLFPSSLYGVF